MEGTVTTICGSLSGGYANGRGMNAKFNCPVGVACDPKGNIYVTEWNNFCIRKITPDGTATTFCGSPGSNGWADGVGTFARFSSLQFIDCDARGNLYVCDRYNNCVRKVTVDGTVTTFCGSRQTGSVDGSGANASFNNPTGIACDPSGNLFVTDCNNHTIRKVSPDGRVTTLCGSAGNQGCVDGKGFAARFNSPIDIACDLQGNLYVTEWNNHCVRKITSKGVVTTLCGSPGQTGFSDGSGSVARFCHPSGIACDANGTLFVADRYNHSIRRVTPNGNVSTVCGTKSGYADGNSKIACFNNPTGLAIDTDGNLIISDINNHVIRKAVLHGSKHPFISKSSSYLQADLLNLLDSGDFSDCTVTLKNKVYKLHKVILTTRCSELLTRNNLKLDIAPECFTSFLQFIYADKVPTGLPFDTIIGTLKCAIEFKQFALANECYQILLNDLQVDNALQLMKLACQYELTELIEYTKYFVVSNRSAFKGQSKQIKAELKDFEEVFDSITELLLSGDSITEPERPQIKSDPKNSLEEDLKLIFEKEQFCDFSLKVEDKVVRCHKAILSSRCQFFASLMNSNMKENSQGELTLPGPTESPGISYSALKSLLLYFYTGEFESLSSGSDCLYILSNAGYFLLSPEERHSLLLRHCQSRVQDNITVDNCLELLKAAHDMQAQDICQITKSFVVHNYAVLHSKYAQQLMQLPQQLNIEILSEVVTFLLQKLPP